MLRIGKKTRLVQDRNIPLGFIIILEVCAIVAGVMLGFAMNEWRETRSNRKIADHALRSIAAEMSYNHRQITSAYDYYNGIVGRIDSMYAAGGSEVRNLYGYQVPGWRGAMPPMLRSSANRMMLMTGIIKDVPFETANTLAFIYNLQSVLEKLDDALIMKFSQDPGFAALETIRHTFGLYVEIMPSVIGVYQEAGKPILGEYGYDLSVDLGILMEEMKRQMQSFPGIE